jgi:hypothetical protein
MREEMRKVVSEKAKKEVKEGKMAEKVKYYEKENLELIQQIKELKVKLISY